MPPLTTPLGYRYPTNVTMDHVRTFGSPRGEGASGGYVFTPNVGYANGTSGTRAQGSAGGSAHVDSMVAGRDAARGSNALLGSAGGAAYMDRVAASREIGRGGVQRTTPDGVSTHFAHLWSERQAAEAAAYRADWIGSFQAAIARRDNEERSIANQRQDIVRTSTGAFLVVNPGFLPRGELVVRITPGRHVSDMEDRLPGSRTPQLDEYMQPVEHPDLLGGSGALFGTRDELKDIPNAPTRMFRVVLVEKPFLDAMQSGKAFHQDSATQVYTDGAGGQAAHVGQPFANAVVLKDGRAAQQFGSAEGPFLVLSARGPERWTKAALVERGLMDADGKAPPLRTVADVNADTVKAALDEAAAAKRKPRKRRSPAQMQLDEKVRANEPRAQDIKPASNAGFMDPKVLKGMDENVDREARLWGETSSVMPRTLQPEGNAFVLGEFMCRVINSRARDNVHSIRMLIMAHPDGSTHTIKGAAVNALLERPAELGGRTVLEVMGRPVHVNTHGYGSWVFEHGAVQNNAYSPGATLRWKQYNNSPVNDPVKLAAAISSPRQDLPLHEAAATLRKHAADVAGANDDTKDVVLTQEELQEVALDANRPPEERSAAAALLASRKRVRAADAPFTTAATRGMVITEKDLVLVALDPKRPQELRSVAASLLARRDLQDLRGNKNALTLDVLAALEKP